MLYLSYSSEPDETELELRKTAHAVKESANQPPDDSWDQLVARLEPVLQALLAAPAAQRLDHNRIARFWAHLFEEGGRPMYVGQSPNLRDRLGNHCRPSGARIPPREAS